MTPAIKKKDLCPCGSGKEYEDCCMETKNQREDDSLTKSSEPVEEIWIDIDESEDIFFNEYLESSPEELWNPTKVASMTTEEIIEKLKSINVHFDKDQFLHQAQDYHSACYLADDHYYTQDWKSEKDEDFIWMAIHELWKRFIPHQPSAEMIDEVIFNGYDFYYSGEYRSSCSEWKKVWKMIKRMMPTDITDVTAIPESIPLFYDLIEWADLYCEVLGLEGLEDNSFLYERITFVREFMKKFPDNDSFCQHLLLMESESYALMKKIKKADHLFQSFIKKYPKNPIAYVLWGTMYWEYNDNPDYEKALKIYRRGLSQCIHNKKIILDQIKKVKKRRKL